MRAQAFADGNVEIPPFLFLISNQALLSKAGTMRDGQFDWGGHLLKSNGGVHKVSSGWLETNC